MMLLRKQSISVMMGVPSCGKHCRGLSLNLAAYKEDFESDQTRWILTAEFQTQHPAGHLFHCKRRKSIIKTCVSLREGGSSKSLPVVCFGLIRSSL